MGFWREYWLWGEALTASALSTLTLGILMALLALLLFQPAFSVTNISVVHLPVLDPLIAVLILVAVGIPTIIYNHFIGHRIDFPHSILAAVLTATFGSILLSLFGIPDIFLDASLGAFFVTTTISIWGAYKLFSHPNDLSRGVYGYAQRRRWA